MIKWLKKNVKDFKIEYIIHDIELELYDVKNPEFIVKNINNILKNILTNIDYKYTN